MKVKSNYVHKCPECGTAMIIKNGHWHCPHCGYTSCGSCG